MRFADMAESLVAIRRLQIGFIVSLTCASLTCQTAEFGNERFMANAKPDLVEKEQQKKADAVAKIAALEKVLA